MDILICTVEGTKGKLKIKDQLEFNPSTFYSIIALAYMYVHVHVDACLSVQFYLIILHLHVFSKRSLPNPDLTHVHVHGLLEIVAILYTCTCMYNVHMCIHVPVHCII